ncbi:MAG: 2-phospho-L-lactate transferase [Bellilinea sp.]|jgi:LPPG:FO 2-phospho-L-lactate transferase
MKVAVLAGGVGGAKLAHGLSLCLPPEQLTIIVNTGDDFSHYGLSICPDVDTVCYTLAGIANPLTGWGMRNETFNALDQAAFLNGPTWFKIGDRDLGTHLERTRRLQAGQPLSQIVMDFCRHWQVLPTVLPMSDDPVRTIIHTQDGRQVPFQEYFVREACQPVVAGFEFEGAEQATPAPGVIQALENSEAIIIAPSNPWVSIAPILAIKAIQEIVARNKAVAVSPIIAGQAIKGPAAKMYVELGIEPSALAVARHHQSLLWGFVFDAQDAELESQIVSLGIIPLIENTIMRFDQDRLILAQKILQYIEHHQKRREK